MSNIFTQVVNGVKDRNVADTLAKNANELADIAKQKEVIARLLDGMRGTWKTSPTQQAWKLINNYLELERRETALRTAQSPGLISDIKTGFRVASDMLKNNIQNSSIPATALGVLKAGARAALPIAGAGAVALGTKAYIDNVVEPNKEHYAEQALKNELDPEGVSEEDFDSSLRKLYRDKFNEDEDFRMHENAKFNHYASEVSQINDRYIPKEKILSLYRGTNPEEVLKYAFNNPDSNVSIVDAAKMLRDYQDIEKRYPNAQDYYDIMNKNGQRVTNQQDVELRRAAQKLYPNSYNNNN